MIRMKKIIPFIVVLFISALVSLNTHMMKNNDVSVDLLLSDVEALARAEAFPACQSQEGPGPDMGTNIPLCVAGKCEKGEGKKGGKLDVNYCP